MLRDEDRFDRVVSYARPVVGTHFLTPSELRALRDLWLVGRVEVLSWNVAHAPYSDDPRETVNALLKAPSGVYFAHVEKRED